MAKNKLTQKQLSEIIFWIKEIKLYEAWYLNEIPSLYYTPAPQPEQRIEAGSLAHSAILTWFERHQKPKYLEELALDPSDFPGKKVLDVGSGPMPSATCLKDARIYSLDPLHYLYKEVGFPYHLYPRTSLLNAYAEKIPLPNRFFDVIISLNAIDHVDNLALTARELARVAKPDCLFAMQVHYHKKTVCEPLEITDERFQNLFSWVKGLRAVKRSRKSYSTTVDDTEQFVLWSNIPSTENTFA